VAGRTGFESSHPHWLSGDVLDYPASSPYVCKNKAETKYHKFMRWLREVPAVGFNSAKYDANIMKMYLSGALSKYDRPEQRIECIESLLLNPLNSETLQEEMLFKKLEFRWISEFSCLHAL